MDPNAVVCVKCGCAKGVGTAYCSNCGQPSAPGAAVCTHCGCSLQTVRPDSKSKIAAGVLGILLGVFGVHNFYLGYTGKAIAQVLLGTIGCCVGVGPLISGIWGLVEGIMILCGNINTDAKGVPLKD
jgi:TM2 domain-containing membrane protein YozV